MATGFAPFAPPPNYAVFAQQNKLHEKRGETQHKMPKKKLLTDSSPNYADLCRKKINWSFRSGPAAQSEGRM